MRTLITMAAVATILAGAAGTAAQAGTASPKERLTQMMTRLQGPETLARPGSTEARHWSLYNWLFETTPDSTADDVVTTMADPLPPSVELAPAPPMVFDSTAPNRIFKRQIGKGQKLSAQQSGAGNTARVFQSN